MRDSLLPSSTRRMSAKEFQARLANLAEQMRSRIEAKVSGFAPDAVAQAARIRRVKDPVHGFRFFAETYFPHYLTKAPSLLHEHLFERLPKIVSSSSSLSGVPPSTPLEQKKGAREVVIAPRGAAKSTLVSLIFPIWSALNGLSKYALVIMDAYAQAALALEAIKAELEENPRLSFDFPEFAGKGRVWREGEIVLRGGTRIEGVGAGMKLRGRRHGAHRPDLVILDDVENDENVRSPEQRDKLEAWILKAVLKLGLADGSMNLFHIGTVLHWDAVIVRNGNRPGWHVSRFKALCQMPDDMQLWDEWEEILRNESEEAAHDFYKAHRQEMDAGAILNWPAMQSLEGLMRERAESPSAFASEQQGEPVPENAPFQDLQFWVLKKSNWLYFGSVDPSLGKKGKGRDPSAILVGALDRSETYPVLNIVEASIRKRLPDLIIADVIALQREYQCQLWFVESVQFQEFLRTELMARALREGVALPAIAVNNITDKALRIERLQPSVAMGAIKFHSSHTTLIQQMTQWPHSDHDDGPDALEMLWTHAIHYGAHALMSRDMIRMAPRSGGADRFRGYSL